MFFNKVGTLIKNENFLMLSSLIENVASYLPCVQFNSFGQKACGYSKFNKEVQDCYYPKSATQIESNRKQRIFKQF